MATTALVVKNLPANAGNVRDVGPIPGSGRSPGVGHGNPLKYFCLENPMEREKPGRLQSMALSMHTGVLKEKKIKKTSNFFLHS